MTVVRRSALVPYEAPAMFKLVNDVRRYPEFVPWCTRAEVLEEGEDELKARLHFEKGALRTSFTTLNRLQPGKMIEMRLVDGPFKHLQGYWRFEPLERGASRVSLDLEFEIANPVLRMTLGPLFTQITNALVDAFVKRAREVYGKV